jgi:putative membrane protein
VLNAEPIELDLFFAKIDVALSVAMVGALILGAALGVVASLGAIWRRGREVHRLRRQLGYTERQLQAMRRSPLGSSSD